MNMSLLKLFAAIRASEKMKHLGPTTKIHAMDLLTRTPYCLLAFGYCFRRCSRPQKKFSGCHHVFVGSCRTANLVHQLHHTKSYFFFCNTCELSDTADLDREKSTVANLNHCCFTQ